MEPQVLEIMLNETLVGYLSHYKSDKNVFVFDDTYIDLEQQRPVLSMSFMNNLQPIETRHQLPTFFSNLLPEGDLRIFIANQLNIHIDDEYSLLSALGRDLPGAIIANLTTKDTPSHIAYEYEEKKGFDEDLSQQEIGLMDKSVRVFYAC